ncbi:hypothetical protein SSP531S_54050 [Streptomyces spongiicola]|uniref:Uncharacterized protein n=1 Tax=Streptomyces spongiicola TaxID=1690221 RepID=A0A388T5Y3_9ACTN|nr:hypothetical protein SSP531S_54050 [Streptomyces spongiicola]
MIVEEIGILAADKRREEPTAIVRPPRSDTTTRSGPGLPPRPQQPTPEQSAPRLSGYRQMLMAATQRGMVRSG